MVNKVFWTTISLIGDEGGKAIQRKNCGNKGLKESSIYCCIIIFLVSQVNFKQTGFMDNNLHAMGMSEIFIRNTDSLENILRT